MKKLLYSFIPSLLVLMSLNTQAQSQTKLDQGMRFIEQNAEKWGLQESDYMNSMVSDMYTNKKTGITYIYLIQAHKGIPIHNAITPLTIDTKGKVRMVRHGYIANAKELISSTKPLLTPVAAIKSATAHLGIVASKMPELRRSNADENIYQFGKTDFAANEIEVKLHYIQDGNKLKLAWSLAIDELDDSDYYNLFVDAASGQVISKHNFTQKCTFHKGIYARHVGCEKDHTQKIKIPTVAEASEAASAMSVAGGTYNVFPLPIESPLYGGRELLVDPFFPDSSPFGWHDTDGEEGAEFMITRGNNVHAYLDKLDTQFSSNDEPNGGSELIFDLPYHPDNQANKNEQAATVNLFYATNMFHDITKRLGFDEPAGNFQFNNYENGGNGNDYVLAHASDGIDLETPSMDNASFTSPGDGNNGVMEMFLWNNPNGVLSIDEPEILAGFISDVGDAINPMGFGSLIPDEQDDPIVGKIVIARDESPGNPTTACSPLINTNEMAGNIALIDRGICDFSLKAYHAQEAGALSVIICNVVGGGGTDGLSSFNMEGGENADLVTIVPLSLGKGDCDRIKASILSDIDVRVTIQDRGPVGPDLLDGSFDNGVIIHEFTHGLSNRLVGGPINAGCLAPSILEQAGEGISDFFALATTVEEGDAGTDLRGMGNYVLGQITTGPGLRTFPYSTDIEANPLVFDDIKTRDPRSYQEFTPHPLGEVWAIALWEVYWAFVDQFGLDTSWEDEDSGNFKALRLVIEGMKQSPCAPSMIDLRDGILVADSLLYDAENAKLLWVAFAKRGFGYLADDGGNSNDVTDGTQSFEPFPLVIEELKIKAKTQEDVVAGEEIEIELEVANHIPATQTGVVVNVNIPDGLTYIDGSASMDATLDDGILKIEIGEMEYLEELTITYRAISSSTRKSPTRYYDNIDDTNLDDYQIGMFAGNNFWFTSSNAAQSGSVSWWASQTDVSLVTDFWMIMPPLDVVGNRPVLKFANRYDTEFAADAGFIQVSRDGAIFEDVKEKFIRNGYNSDIQYPTFAIPLLEGFSGSTNGEFIDSYLDLSDYKGEQIFIRFRFGTDDNTGVSATYPGWFVDDIEMIDLKSYESMACISSENSTDEQCSEIMEIYIESDQIVNTYDEQLMGFSVAVAPNPASDYISVGVSAEKTTPIQLMFTAIDGRVIQSLNMLATTNQSIRTFDTSNLEKGMYLVQIKSEKGLTTKKVVIQ